MSDEEDDIILSELDDEELVQQMFDDLYAGLKEEIEEGVADGDLVFGVAGAHGANHRRFVEVGRNSEQTN